MKPSALITNFQIIPLSSKGIESPKNQVNLTDSRVPPPPPPFLDDDFPSLSSSPDLTAFYVGRGVPQSLPPSPVGGAQTLWTQPPLPVHANPSKRSFPQFIARAFEAKVNLYKVENGRLLETKESRVMESELGSWHGHTEALRKFYFNLEQGFAILILDKPAMTTGFSLYIQAQEQIYTLKDKLTGKFHSYTTGSFKASTLTNRDEFAASLTDLANLGCEFKVQEFLTAIITPNPVLRFEPLTYTRPFNHFTMESVELTGGLTPDELLNLAVALDTPQKNAGS